MRFAVCNFLERFRQTGEDHYRQAARHLVSQVHSMLGRHRQDDSRHGGISGLVEQEVARHPPVGGLGIGKELPERGPDEAYDAILEWDRDSIRRNFYICVR